MARLVTSGGEIRDHPTASIGSPDGYSGGAAATTTETTVFRSGKAAIKCPGTSANSAYRIFPFPAPAAGTYIYAREFFRISALPNATKIIARLTAGATNLVGARLTSVGKLQLFSGASTQIGSDSADTIAVDRWYRLQLMCKIGAGATDEAELRLATDEALPPDYPSVQVAAGTGLSITDTQPTEIRLGWVEAPGVTASVFLDDVSVNDSTGTQQNSWPPAMEKILLLKPKPVTSFPAQTGWTSCKGDSGTVDWPTVLGSTPPVGHADSSSDSTMHQIRSVVAPPNSTSLGLVGGNRLGAIGVQGGATAAGALDVGRFSNPGRRAFGLYFQGTFGHAELWLNVAGSPTDDLICELQTDSAGLPSGTVLSTATIPGSSISTTASWVDVVFSDAVPLDSDTLVWVVCRRSGAIDGTNYYKLYGSNPTTDIQLANYNEGTSLWAGAVSVGWCARVYPSEGTAWFPVYTLLCCHGEGDGPLTKTGDISTAALGIPDFDLFTFDYGDNAGACGTYPTNWSWAKTTMYDQPLRVDRGPTMTVHKTDSDTRIACVCFMGAYIGMVPPISPGWVQYQKTADSSLWWAKYVSDPTVFQWGTMGVNLTKVTAGDYAMHADPLPAEEADMGEITSVTQATLDADYTKV